MASPMRALVTSKQIVIIVAALIIALVILIGSLNTQWWLVSISTAALVLMVAVVVADIHRKMGRAMAEIRIGNTARVEILNGLSESISTDADKRLVAIETAGQATASELATLRAQLLTRFDVLTKELLANSRKLADAAGSVSSSASDLRSATADEASRLSRVLDRAARGMETVLNEVEETLKRTLDGSLEGERAELQRLHQVLITEIDAMLQVHDRLGFDGPIPLMGGWAMSPVGMKTLIDLATEPGVASIVECGSGTSTVLMALTLLRGDRTDARIVSFDHLAEYAELTQSQLTRLGLGAYAEVRHAPLESFELDEVEYRWYARSAFADLSGIDLLVVDGPPGATNPMARYPAYPLLRNALSPNAVIVLDDVRRSDERGVAARWLEDDRLARRNAQPTGQLVLDYKSD
jgi:predicted O-methyltransferase YrrM